VGPTVSRKEEKYTKELFDLSFSELKGFGLHQ